MDKVQGIVERITYRNEENGFCVIKIRSPKSKEPLTAVGNMASVNAGSMVTLTGEWKTDSRYGRQLKVHDYQEDMPVKTKDMERYLGSGLIKGIGPVNAARLVEHFQEETFRVIEKEPHRLEEVAGIGPKRVEMIRGAWEEHKEVKNVMVFLQQYGVSVSYGIRIFKTYGKDSIRLIKENPYRLADDIWGIGFKTADSIAQSLGYAHDSMERCRCGMLYELGQGTNEGHCFLPAEELTAKTAAHLEVEQALAEEALRQLTQEEQVIVDEEEAVYLPTAFYSETGTARCIAAVLQAPKQKSLVHVEDIIQEVEKEKGVAYDQIQKQAIFSAAQEKFLVLTGGPGTGKTTTVLGILRVFEKMGAKVRLAAPTGRAAKKMAETTQREASTIHRLLEFTPPAGYKRDEDHPLDCDVLIVDETSMIDVFLMYSLLKAVPEEAVVVLVGDVDQLPPVGAGNVLKDMIESRLVPVIRLTQIFRQAKGSLIVNNAHRINQGSFPLLKSRAEDDFFFSEEEDPNRLLDLIVDLCCRRLPRRFPDQEATDIQVISPMMRGVVGVNNLNEVLQFHLNKETQSVTYGGTTFKKNDKVMQIRNNYDKDVYNGDVGKVCEINCEDQQIAVLFDQRRISYERAEMDELVLAYAATVHKSQGSEYPIVIAPLLPQHYMMLQRNLLYTCITRAKKLMILLGTKKAVGMAVANNRVEQRNTKLAEHLKEILKDK